MRIRRTVATVAATAALVLLPASAFAGTSGDDYQRGDYQRNAYHHSHPKYAPPCPDKGDHRPPHYERPKPPPSTTTTTTTTVTVTRTLHTL